MVRNVIHVILSEEAETFVRLQPLKAQQKITYNIRKLESGVRDKDPLRNLTIQRYGSCVHCLTVFAIACSPFGTRKGLHLLL